jgi:hypothetical protein
VLVAVVAIAVVVGVRTLEVERHCIITSERVTGVGPNRQSEWEETCDWRLVRQ